MCQVLKLREMLRERGLGAVNVGTVDDYQGQEKCVTALSNGTRTRTRTRTCIRIWSCTCT